MIKKVFCGLVTLWLSFPVLAASFDCHQARYADEKAICSSPVLNDLDIELSVKYHFLHGLFAMGTAGKLKDAQDLWLIQRRKCQGDAHCLTDAYQHRIQELNRLYASIEKPL